MAQTIVTKFLAPTNARGPRVVAKCWKGKVTVNWDYSMESENHRAAAEALIANLNERTGCEWKIVASGNMPDGSGYAFIIQ